MPLEKTLLERVPPTEMPLERKPPERTLLERIHQRKTPLEETPPGGCCWRQQQGSEAAQVWSSSSGMQKEASGMLDRAAAETISKKKEEKLGPPGRT